MNEQYAIVPFSYLSFDLTKREWQVFLHILGNLGNNEKCWVEGSTIAETTGITKDTVYKMFQSLMRKKVIERVNINGRWETSLGEAFQHSLPQTFQCTPPNLPVHSPKPSSATGRDFPVLYKDENNNENNNKITRKNMAKKERVDKDFDTFWEAYPRKVKKKEARKAWDSTKKVRPELSTILEAVEKWKESEFWKKDGGQFIPYPASWLNGERWDDEVPVIETQIDRNRKIWGLA